MAEATNFDGFYTAYLSGVSGRGMAMLIFSNGSITGSDIMGLHLDGTYVIDHASDVVRSNVTITVPPYTTLIQGHTTGADIEKYNTEASIPIDLKSNSFFTIKGPFGPTNVNLIKNRNEFIRLHIITCSSFECRSYGPSCFCNMASTIICRCIF